MKVVGLPVGNAKFVIAHSNTKANEQAMNRLENPKNANPNGKPKQKNANPSKKRKPKKDANPAKNAAKNVNPKGKPKPKKRKPKR